MLKDVDARKWSTDDLNTFINIAVEQWTTDVPVGSTKEFTVVSGQKAYDLPSDAVCAYWVLGYFEGAATPEFIAPMTITPGRWSMYNEPRRFIYGYPTDSQFYLPREPQGTSFTLVYGAVHAELDDDADTLDLRQMHWGKQAVIAYAAYQAHLPFSSSHRRREQFKRRPDLDTGDPMGEAAQNWLETYELLVARNAQPAVWTLIKEPKT